MVRLKPAQTPDYVAQLAVVPANPWALPPLDESHQAPREISFPALRLTGTQLVRQPLGTPPPPPPASDDSSQARFPWHTLWVALCALDWHPVVPGDVNVGPLARYGVKGRLVGGLGRILLVGLRRRGESQGGERGAGCRGRRGDLTYGSQTKAGLAPEA